MDKLVFTAHTFLNIYQARRSALAASVENTRAGQRRQSLNQVV